MNPAKQKKGEPPLLTEQFQEIDPVTQENVSVVRHTRGVLTTEKRTYAAVHPDFFNCKTVRQHLEEYCDYIRDRLETRGLPTDRTPRWMKVGDGDWTEQ